MSEEVTKKQETALLSSLMLEVDDVFLSLRKADKIIRRELYLLNLQKFQSLSHLSIPLINESRLKEIIGRIPTKHLFLDEYITYMITSKDNSIFKLIENYNLCLEKRNNEQKIHQYEDLKNTDEKLAHYIRHLGAMIYHLNIHLNLLNVLLKNTLVRVESSQKSIKKIEDAVTEYMVNMVNEWGSHQQDFKFEEITIDEQYAIVTWLLEELRGDAILVHNEGEWQLITISTGRFELEDFENAGVPWDVSQRMLKQHRRKLGY